MFTLESWTSSVIPKLYLQPPSFLDKQIFQPPRHTSFSSKLFPRIIDQASGTEIASFPIYKVLFCARGQEGSVESDCFSFTESYRSSEDFQIHVFSCHIKEAVSYVNILWYIHISNCRSPWISHDSNHRLLPKNNKRAFIPPMLSSLHWLHINFCIHFQSYVPSFRALHEQTPQCS